jgi:hypothetical protein
MDLGHLRKGLVSTMNRTLLSQADYLAADLDRCTARLKEIVKTNADHPTERARELCHIALISIWAHTTEPATKRALNRLMRALKSIV